MNNFWNREAPFHSACASLREDFVDFALTKITWGPFMFI
jgi:hypothetical protein